MTEEPDQNGDAEQSGIEPEVRAFAEWQLAREIGAREQIARGAGLALIDLTSILEEQHAVIDPNVDPLGIVLIAFAARGRRLLRAAYRLLDAGEVSEAPPLLRTISEYLAVGLWLTKYPERLGAWALADIRKRKFVIGETIRTLGDEAPDTRASLATQITELEGEERRWLNQHGEPRREDQVVPLDQMAADVDLDFAYQMAYRTQSQVDVHATPVAVDACYERLPDGRLRLLPMPAHSLRTYSEYEVGAHLLRDVMSVANHHVRSFLWTTGLEGITAALEALRANDPRKYVDPTSQIVAAGAGEEPSNTEIQVQPDAHSSPE